jgi:hypothetical protein
MNSLVTYEALLDSWKQSADIKVEPLVNESTLLGILRIQGVVLAVFVHQVPEDGATEREKTLIRIASFTRQVSDYVRSRYMRRAGPAQSL